MSEQELTFSDHIDKVSTEKEGAIFGAMYKQLIFTFGPIVGPLVGLSYLLNYLQLDIVKALSITFSTMIAFMYFAKSWQDRATEYVRGKKVFVLTARLNRGNFFSDFGIVQAIHEVEVTDAEKEKLYQKPTEKIKKLINLHKLEVVFADDFEYFKRMILYSEVSDEGLCEFTDQFILAKDYITRASASPIDVTILRTWKYGDEWIPHAIPTGCDYICEQIREKYGSWIEGKIEVEEGQRMFDRWLYFEARDALVSRDASLASARKTIKEKDFEAADKAGDAIEAFIGASMQEKESKPVKVKLKKILPIVFICISIAIGWYAWTYWYVPMSIVETGNLNLITTPVAGQVFVDGDLKGNGSISVVLSVGNHTLSFGKVEGYKTPSPQVIPIKTGQTANLNVVYTKGGE